jgi:hypothetical protein
MTLKLIEDQLHITCKRIFQILHEDLRKRKICVKSDNEQKEHRGKTCDDFTQTCHISPHFVDYTITADEWWVFQYVPKTEYRSTE